MKMNDFLDRYIQGDEKYYYFDIEIIHGKNIQGGQFHYKKDARKLLLKKLIDFLDDPETFMEKKNVRNI